MNYTNTINKLKLKSIAFATTNNFTILKYPVSYKDLKLNNGAMILRHNTCGLIFGINFYRFEKLVLDSSLRFSRNLCPYCNTHYYRCRWHHPNMYLSHGQYLDRLLFGLIVFKNTNGNYHLASMVSCNGLLSHVSIAHFTCGHIYKSTMLRFLIGFRCPYCKKSDNKKIYLKNEIYDKELKLCVRQPTIIEKYYMSKGESIICNFLKKWGIEYKYGYILKNKLHLDFYLPIIFTSLKNSGGIGIEYDGKQHFAPVEKFGGKKTFLKQCKNDRRKDLYCFNHHIKLYRIPYTIGLNNIENYLLNKLPRGIFPYISK